MYIKKFKILFFAVLLLSGITGCFTNDPYPSHIKFKNNEALLSPTQQQTILQQVDSMLNRSYINQTEITSKLSKLKNINTDSAFLATDLAQKITLTLREAFNDKHLALYYDTALVNRLTYEQRKGNNWNDIKFYEAYIEHEDLIKSHNFDFEKVEILSGNIAYLKFNYFAKLSNAQPTIDAAMQFVSNADALIIDLQENAGGHVLTAEYISGLFYPENTTLFYRTLNDETEMEYFAKGEGPKSLWNIPLYVLISERTASAAEIITNTFMETKRAKVIGSLTWGGAHACSFIILNDAFVLLLPLSKVGGPVSKTNWEAKGIKPDITKAPENIIDNAHHLAVSDLLDKTINTKAKRKYKGILKTIEAKFNKALPKLSDYTGTYGNHQIIEERNALFYNKEGNRAVALIPIKDDEFILQNSNFETVFFSRTKKGKVYAANFIKSKGDTLSYLINENDFGEK